MPYITLSGEPHNALHSPRECLGWRESLWSPSPHPHTHTHILITFQETLKQTAWILWWFCDDILLFNMQELWVSSNEIKPSARAQKLQQTTQYLSVWIQKVCSPLHFLLKLSFLRFVHFEITVIILMSLCASWRTKLVSGWEGTFCRKVLHILLRCAVGDFDVFQIPWEFPAHVLLLMTVTIKLLMWLFTT